VHIVNASLSPAKATLLPPTQSGYLLLAAEIDRRPMFLPSSAPKRRLIAELKQAAIEVESQANVVHATVFDGFAHLVFGENHPLLRRGVAAGRLQRARYDLVVLVETTSPSAAQSLRASTAYSRLAARVQAAAHRTYAVAASSPRTMGDVEVTRPGVFLFNFFYAQDDRELLPVWEYTAGWWMVNTGLDNSRVMAPLEGERRDYGITNFCRWDHLRDVAPQMILRSSFRRFVLANFAANGISAQPSLYRAA